MKTTRRIAIILAVAAGILGAPVQAQDNVNVRFSWKMKGEYGAFYQAQEAGHYKKANLAVRLGEGAGAPAALGALVQGQEDVVVLPGIFAISAIQKGMPIKLVAMYHPKTPFAFISHPERPIRVPKDLEGKTMGTSVGDTGTSYLDLFCKINKVDCSKIKRVQMNSQALVPQFLARQIDSTSVYRSNDLPALIQREAKIVVMDIVEFGMAIPGMAAVTSEANLAKRPEVLKRFLAATATGFRESKEDIVGTSKAILKSWNAGPDMAVVLGQVKATMEAVPVYPGKRIGWIDEKLIASTLEMMKGVGEIDSPKPVASFYTNALVQ
ncbi:MAG: ABC transporter substrate-binding protein [Burkholderiales bacterium]